MNDQLTKSQRKELRKLQGLAWERELENALRELKSDFDAWEKGEISPFDLSDSIHEFHDGRSRTLYNMYAGGRGDFFLGPLVARGIINESELSEGLLEFYKDSIERCRKDF